MDKDMQLTGAGDAPQSPESPTLVTAQSSQDPGPSDVTEVRPGDPVSRQVRPPHPLQPLLDRAEALLARVPKGNDSEREIVTIVRNMIKEAVGI